MRSCTGGSRSDLHLSASTPCCGRHCCHLGGTASPLVESDGCDVADEKSDAFGPKSDDW